jgi:hypothetical protein
MKALFLTMAAVLFITSKILYPRDRYLALGGFISSAGSVVAAIMYSL